MKIITLRGTFNRRTMLIGLWHNTIEMLKTTLLISLGVFIVFLPFILLVEKKTSDQDFCPRIVSQKIRQQVGCPPNNLIANR